MEIIKDMLEVTLTSQPPPKKKKNYIIFFLLMKRNTHLLIPSRSLSVLVYQVPPVPPLNTGESFILSCSAQGCISTPQVPDKTTKRWHTTWEAYIIKTKHSDVFMCAKPLHNPQHLTYRVEFLYEQRKLHMYVPSSSTESISCHVTAPLCAAQPDHNGPLVSYGCRIKPGFVLFEFGQTTWLQCLVITLV